jgi:cell fate regulator YaaT (PSP1 superfamily)
MIEFVGVKFRPTGKVYNFLTDELELDVGDQCVVETERGYGFGTVDVGHMLLDETLFRRPLKKVVRKATPEDYAMVSENRRLEVEALEFCRKRAIERRLDMQLVNVEYTFDRSRMTFYFLADGRIDFRELVKDLAQQYKTRIEMRQIGVRDEAKLIGGYGVCGRPLCCQTFMRNFETVSIKMAKVQGLALNPSKLSGICDRLKCCLTYEYDYYRQMAKYMPRRGQMIRHCDGSGPFKVREINYLEQSVVVDMGNGTKQKLFYRELEKVE